MLKIKKGIKKKIKGKKEKDDELFTPEELEKYKREKEEESRRLAQQQQEKKSEDSAQPQRDASATTEEGAAGSSEAKESSAGDSDWRNFFAATDTVLKQTSDNLVHIREASFFQRKEEKPAAEAAKSATPAPPAAPACGKKWVDLEAGGIDDGDEVEGEPQKQEPQQEPEPEPEPAPLHFIEDLPDVDVDDFTEVFDTTYVDNVESGQVRLHYIPDSPTTADPNEPDPFDTSVVDRVLHAEEAKPKVREERKPQQEEEEERKTKKKQKKLVSLGCAVEVLTGNVQGVEKPSSTPPAGSKRRRVVTKEVNLLADFTDNGKSAVEASEKEGGQKTEESNVLEILCAENLDAELPEGGVVVSLTPRAVSPVAPSIAEEDRNDSDVIINNGCEGGNKEVDLSEFLESSGDDQDSKETKPDNGKDLDLKDLVAEFDIIDKSEVTNDTLVVSEQDAVDDEFDAEFAFLAAESVAKSKEKEFDIEDDPFDTSVATQVLGPEETVDTERDPFDVTFAEGVLGEEKQKVKPAKPPPPRPAPPKVEQEVPKEVDPFDTSIADKHLPVDPFALTEPDTNLSETLQPQPESQIKNSESFDPFDTSIAESFGKTELKVLESELLTATETEPTDALKKSDSDFDFNPRGEASSAAPARPPPPVRPPPCLLTRAENEEATAPVLAPSQDTQQEDFDPFDTSIAAKVEIQTIEAELLNQPEQLQERDKQELAESKKTPPARPAPAQVHFLATTPTDTNPTLQPSTVVNEAPKDEAFDPFDTSIADNFGKTELKSLENELLSSQQEATEVNKAPSEKPKSKVLDLPIKPLCPPVPKCLLATTPLDEQPTLQPEVGTKTEPVSEEVEDFDPFDTSIAEQFGKTELKVLESELLVAAPPEKAAPEEDFDPRVESKAPARPPRPSRPSSPARPQCLLTSSPARTPTESELLVPSESKPVDSKEEFDPFDTSIADRFGKTELKHLEKELLTAGATSVSDDFDDFDPRSEEARKPKAPPKPPRPERPQLPAPCLLAVTPTDSSAPLQPSLNPVQGPEEGATAEDFDPFDTSIADKLGRTEIKALEETLFTKESETASGDTVEVSTLSVTGDSKAFTAERLLSLSPTPDLGPTLQPVSEAKREEPEEFDPFDTSIADKFGKTELKTLESELLSDSGTKRNLSDDEFDPREEENKVPKRPPPPVQKPVTPVSLLDSSDDLNVPDQPIQAHQAQSKETALDDYDPFDTSIAADIALSKAELKYIETELLSADQDPFDTSNVP